MPTLTYAEAGLAALREEMRRDATIFHLSTDAPPALLEEFGPRRVIDTPISEEAILGAVWAPLGVENALVAGGVERRQEGFPEQVLDHHVGDQRLEHRHFDVLADAGALALDERGQNGDRERL